MSANKSIIQIESDGIETFSIDEGLDNNDNERSAIELDSLGPSVNTIVRTINTVKEIVGFEGRRTVSISNKTGKTIKIEFDKESQQAQNGLTHSYSIKPIDGLFGTINYECEVCDDVKCIRFWAYGKLAPRANNFFEVRKDGVWLKANDVIKEDTLRAKWK